MAEIRLAQLGLPMRITELVQRLDCPTKQEQSSVDALLLDYRRKHEVIRRLLQPELQSPEVDKLTRETLTKPGLVQRQVLSRLNRFSSQAQRYSITISAGGTPDDTSEVSTSRIPIPLLLQCHPALNLVQYLFLSVPECGMGLGNLTFPSVSSLVVSCPPSIAGSIDAIVLSTPNIRKAVFLNMLRTCEPLITRNVPWLQLTHLFIGKAIDPADMGRILRLCTNVQRAGFWLEEHLSSWYGYDHEELKTVELSNLKELTIIWGKNEISQRSSGPSQILDRTTLPSLAELRIFSAISWNFGAEVWRPFLNITRLTLVGRPGYRLGGSCDVHHIFDACPLVVELVIPVPQHIKYFFQGLAYDHAKPKGLHLEILVLLLHVNNYYYGGLEADDLHNLLASRSYSDNPSHPPPPILKRFILRCFSRPETARDVEINRMRLTREQTRLSDIISPFAAKGIQLAVETTSAMELTSCPISESDLKHWDHGMMDFLSKEENHVFTTSMPRPAPSAT
ncbi:hypothetical protein NMY22_g2747 [Coprinellus aureogranulatus]|nr:hypothetical protein NMY22_g2747 [Coprinellus aureogranulatus]